ncbi:Putative tyrosine-protein kinase Wsck [Atta colombica]|uniref:Putative tyrosine-protein kinase Wsck n=1 Tax=Atta colombica TaxID=520822 RepID=A0A195BN37_9HYME|nr:PREDICTED: putative tyrosine-protein kinase Wsck [Atta colombica]KYM86577.1 Putative tyrosine-protein kinase Wsck [Atta colombica]
MIITSSFLFFCGVYFACAQKYEGCFRSSDLNELPTPTLGHASTPAECVKKCRSQYYMFAGLMNGQQCYCVNKFGQPSDSCTVTCASDSSYYCGSYEAMSVYATGQQGPSPPRRISVTEETKDTLKITWQPPDIPNGKIIFYTIRAVVEETYSSNNLSPIESQIQGGSSNMTILRGLQPGTKYHISITASNTLEFSEPANTTGWTLIGPPDKPVMPKILEHGKDTITVMLTEAHSEYGPISAYQVFVVQADAIPPPVDEEYLNYDSASKQGLSYYVAAQFEPLDFHRYKKFVVGDGRMIGGYHNLPLQDQFVSAQVGLMIISRKAAYVQRSYSDLANIVLNHQMNQMDTTALALCIAITLLSILLAISILIYFVLRRRHERFHMQKLPEQQELTLQGPVYEVDNMGYIPEDIPERVNHYQELKKKIWSIPQNALSVDDHVIRRGRFGSVHTGTVLKDDKSCLVTIHTIVDGALKGSDKRHMLRELDVCIRAGSMKYLAGLVGTCETTDMLYVVLELPPQILKDRLLGARSGDVFPIDQILSISSSIAIALQYLASHKIIHSRLCARSVGLSDDWTPKLMGHGIAKYALQDLKYARWTAIECFDNQTKHQPGMIWAFGVLLWEMFSMGGTPYSNLALDSEVENAIMRGIRLPQLLDVTDPIYEVMSSCWRDDPEERPTFDELIRLDTLSVCPITAITEPYLPELELN